ncbi:GD19573 [Drosophila simulans]|uniref:GD19573 n=1 Tax=Drosophila simulans TaxID=7240 RepID=B4QXM2_DROSI|nr:GD19573 [Drosophila simulans]
MEWHLSIRTELNCCRLWQPNPVTSEAACHLSRSTRHFVQNPGSWFWLPDSWSADGTGLETQPSHPIRVSPVGATGKSLIAHLRLRAADADERQDDGAEKDQEEQQEQAEEHAKQKDSLMR